MKSVLPLTLCFMLLCCGGLPEALGAEPAAKMKKVRKRLAAKAPEEPTLSVAELLNPYSAAQNNATRWQFDPGPQGRPFGQGGEESPVSLRLGPESVRDPLTQKELTPKADPQKAKESLKNMDLKGAMDKAGGKAEVKVDIFKF